MFESIEIGIASYASYFSKADQGDPNSFLEAIVARISGTEVRVELGVGP